MQAICLECNRQLPLLEENESGQYICNCGTKIPFTHGIYQFVKENTFYEGKFAVTHQHPLSSGNIFARVLSYISIDRSETRMWRKSAKIVKHHARGRDLQILNIGSGGGHIFLNDLGSVTAIDLSLASLLQSQRIYESCYQADARRIPFPDESFDLVFSSHVLGHIPLEYKQIVIKEIHRVTKPGGFSLHSAECEADNFIYRNAKRYPQLYRRYFIEMYGHYGLEYPSICIKRFRNESFEPIYEMSDYCKGIVRPISSYKVFLGDAEFRKMDWRFNALAKISEILSSNNLLRFTSDILLYPLTLINRIAGPDTVDSVKLLYRKNG